MRQKIASDYNTAAVHCNSHVQENMLSSNRFTLYKARPYLGFHNLGFHFKILGCHFDSLKRLKKHWCFDVSHATQTLIQNCMILSFAQLLACLAS